MVGEPIQRNSFVKNEKVPQPTFTWKIAHVSDGKQNFPLRQLTSIMQVKVPIHSRQLFVVLSCPSVHFTLSFSPWEENFHGKRKKKVL